MIHFPSKMNLMPRCESILIANAVGILNPTNKQLGALTPNQRFGTRFRDRESKDKNHDDIQISGVTFHI